MVKCLLKLIASDMFLQIHQALPGFGLIDNVIAIKQ